MGAWAGREKQGAKSGSRQEAHLFTLAFQLPKEGVHQES